VSEQGAIYFQNLYQLMNLLYLLPMEGGGGGGSGALEKITIPVTSRQVIEAMGGGEGGSSGGTGSEGAWEGGGGGSGALEKITIPVTSRQVIGFTIGVGGDGGAQPTQSIGNGTSTTVTMTLLTANG